MLVCCSARALPGCSPGPRKSTTNSEQPAVDPLVLLTFGPLRRCRYGTGIVAVELAADPLVVILTFGRMRRCQNDQHVDYRCQKGVCVLILYVEAMRHFRLMICTATKHVLPTFTLMTILRVNGTFSCPDLHRH